MKTIEKARRAVDKVLYSEKGGLAGYGLAWLFGVPISILVIIYLIRGH
jgi:hypothetical protein